MVGLLVLQYPVLSFVPSTPRLLGRPVFEEVNFYSQTMRDVIVETDLPLSGKERETKRIWTREDKVRLIEGR